MAVRRFEDLKGWQAARDLVRMVYGCTGREPFTRDYRRRDQIQGAAISIMANIAEGFDCDTNRENARFLGFARRSASEVQSLLYITYDLAYITQEEFEQIYDGGQTTKKLMGGFIRHLRNTPDPRQAQPPN